MKKCYFCGSELDAGDTVGRHETCSKCHRDLRCCLNCSLYDLHASNHCREPQSEEIRERDRSNFCDFFIFSDSDTKNENGSEVKKAKEEWERLFRKQ